MVFRAWIATTIATCLLPRNEFLVAQESHGQGTDTSIWQKSATADAAYRIGPQDILQIDVWKGPEITRTIPVRLDEKSSHSYLSVFEDGRNEVGTEVLFAISGENHDAELLDGIWGNKWRMRNNQLTGAGNPASSARHGEGT